MNQYFIKRSLKLIYIILNYFFDIHLNLEKKQIQYIGGIQKGFMDSTTYSGQSLSPGYNDLYSIYGFDGFTATFYVREISANSMVQYFLTGIMWPFT